MEHASATPAWAMFAYLVSGVLFILALRGLSSDDAAGPSVFKLVWANWHRRLGEVAMDVAGASGLTAGAPAAAMMASASISASGVKSRSVMNSVRSTASSR